MSSFHERQKSLFNHLKDAEEQHSFSKANKVDAHQDYGCIDRQTYRDIKNKMRQFRGKESIYKRQQGNIRDCLRAKKIPDHMKNPQNYVYYSLSDVTPEQMSDRTNTATALAHMKTLEEKEANQSQKDADDGVFKKPSFRPSVTIKSHVEPDDKPMFKDNKMIMPEYVVGAKPKREKKVKEIKKDNGTQNEKKAELILNHLFEHDE